MDIFTEKTPYGSLLLSTIEGNRRIKHLYDGYTIREAKRLFRTYVKEELKKA